MSNHSGSYMLNRVLCIAEEMEIFETIGEEKTQELVEKIINMSGGYDCNSGEISDDIGERLGLCYCCIEKKKNLEYGICKECRE